jgi:hypothetical protein
MLTGLAHKTMEFEDRFSFIIVLDAVRNNIDISFNGKF